MQESGASNIVSASIPGTPPPPVAAWNGGILSLVSVESGKANLSIASFKSINLGYTDYQSVKVYGKLTSESAYTLMKTISLLPSPSMNGGNLNFSVDGLQGGLEYEFYVTGTYNEG